MKMEIIAERISQARKKAGMTQEQFAEQLQVTPQAVSKWENGKNMPDIDNLMRIAEITNMSYLFLLTDAEGEGTEGLKFRDRLFHEDNMFTRVRSFALSEGLNETVRALEYMRRQHSGQFRKQAFFTAEKIAYINHPLLMCCQAHAFGIRDDALLSAILLHDVVEDTGVSVEELPFSDEVRKIVSLVSFHIREGMTKEESKKDYYKKIRQNGKACVVKAIDRCNNVSTMSGSFSRDKMAEYIMETETYVFPVLDTLKNEYPEYNDLAFLIKYQLLALLETIKCLL